MPSIEVEQPVAPPATQEEQKPKIGIIYPPPEVRNIVDKTASFVARNGPEFESRIRQNEINNTKFNFLNPADPYHAYYQHKVKDFSEGRAVESTALKVTAPSAARLAQETPKAIQEAFVPKESPPEPEFIADPPSINALDLDIVKLTAQFVARNGRQFLTQLMNREQRNYQFDFLRPQHCLFNYFTKLVEQYTKILIPPKDLITRLRKECESSESVLEQVKYRVDWQKYQEKQKKQEQEASERERVAYAMIDWHDFVVVETVDFQPNEAGNFPAPTTPEEVGARVLAEERKSRPIPAESREPNVDLDIGLEEPEEDEGIELNEESDVSADEDMDQSDEETETDKTKKKDAVPPPPPPPILENTSISSASLSPPPAPPQPVSSGIRPPLPPSLDQVVIRRDYDPKSLAKPAVQPGEEVYLVSPFTGERIPVSQVPKHVRIGLLDQKWIEQRDREAKEKRDDEQVFASGALIESSLKHLAERRTDIFGVGVDETVIGKKLGEEERAPSKPEELIWDGHSGSMETVSKRARESITAEAQQERLSRMKHLEEEREKMAPMKPPPPPVTAGVPQNIAPPPPVSTVPNPVFVPPPPPVQRPMMMAAPPMARPLQPPGAFIVPMPRPVNPAFLTPMQVPPQAPMMGMPPNPVQQQNEDAESSGPPSKKQRTEESLIPEEVFLRSNKFPIAFRVSIPGPIPDKPEWRLNNQFLTFTMPLTETIATVKSRIADEIGMPAGKQKLQIDGLFLKDTNSLAFYNMIPNTVVQLLPKERGGRRK